MSITEALRKVRALNRRAELKRGERSEEDVDQALDLLIKKGTIVTSWSASGSEDRESGIDRHIQLPDGSIIPLQVKSSDTGVKKAKTNFPHIPVIRVSDNEDIKDLSNRITGLIQSKLDGKF